MSEEKIEINKPKRKFRRAGNGSDWIAKEDVKTLKAWEKGQIVSVIAAKRIASNNEWDNFKEDEFIQLAHSLGYWRKGKYEEYVEHTKVQKPTKEL